MHHEGHAPTFAKVSRHDKWYDDAGSGRIELVRDVLLAAQVHLEATRRPKGAAKALKHFVNLRNGLGQTALELASKYGC